MSARRLAAVPAPTPAPAPRLRRVTMADATRVHPNNPKHARLWLRAVNVLRTKTRRGWLMDRPATRQEPKA